MRINFELQDVRAFLMILDLGGFHRAADILGMSQPALSRRIQALEFAVGAPLLERTTRRVAPTTIGRTFAPIARRLIDEFEDSVLNVTGLGDRQSGHITIACVPTAVVYFLPKVIEQFSRSYEKIRFRILDLPANDGLEAVRRGEADFGINFTGNADADLAFTPLLEDTFVLACHRGHKLSAKEELSWGDLEGEPLIGVARSSVNRQIIESALAKSDIKLVWRFEVNHLATSMGLVERGLGVSVLPVLATPPNPHPIIVTRPIVAPIVQRTIGLVERKSGRVSPIAQRFRDMLVQRDNAEGTHVSGL
ncbi:MAG: LysR family transcriptional regulator [Hyphomicrobiales bacterium]|nr:LysR family transcriptional regulator [Hyphomicrobiales bacterium]